MNGSDVTRYYLTTAFNPDESLDNIDVEIYEIISEKCDLDLIRKGSGCEPKHLEEIEKPNTIWGSSDTLG